MPSHNATRKISFKLICSRDRNELGPTWFVCLDSQPRIFAAWCHCAHRKCPEKTDLKWSVNFYPSEVKEMNGEATGKLNKRRGIRRTKRYFGNSVRSRNFTPVMPKIQWTKRSLSLGKTCEEWHQSMNLFGLIKSHRN
jgi:hypothetical protein